MNSPPIPGQRYLIGLCSGETRVWEFVGIDAQSFEWWRDIENGTEFCDANLMYAWWIIEPHPL